MKRKIVKFEDVGAKVVRGPDWKWKDQDKGSIYGIILPNASSKGWVSVDWIGPKNKVIASYGYSIGTVYGVPAYGVPAYDLYYYDQYEHEVFIYDTDLEKITVKPVPYNINLIITKIN
jgi:hypothetical protein